jgi:hypothetical protein
MGIALAISIPVSVLVLILLILGFTFDYVGQKQRHERQVLALQKGLPVPPEPVTVGPRSKVLLWIALVAPPICALVGLGITIWTWNQPQFPLQMRWDITGVAFLVTGWVACIIVSATAVIAAVRSFIVAAQQNPSVPTRPPESHNP